MTEWPRFALAVRERRPKSTSPVTCQGSYTASFPSYRDLCLSELRSLSASPQSLSASPQRCRRITCLGPDFKGDVSLRGAARADRRGDSGINQAPTGQVAHCGRNRERLGRHRRGSCRSGQSATDRDRQWKPDDYRRNRHDDDAADSSTDGERQPDHESASSQGLLRPNARGVAGPTRSLFRRMSAFGRGRFGTDENLYQLISAEQSATLQTWADRISGQPTRQCVPLACSPQAASGGAFLSTWTR